MDGLLSFLCLLCVLITPGHSLSCIKCMGVNSCTGNSETCLPDYSCGLAYRETAGGATSTTKYILSCVSNTKCNKMGSISYSGGTMKIGFSCCDTDNCTPPLPQLPAISSQANGLVCPSCQGQNSCDQQTNIQCTGSQQTCIYQTSSSEAVMGCGTSTLCDVADYTNNFLSVQFYCFPATSSTATGTSCVTCISFYSLTCNASLSVIPENYKCASSYLIANTNGAKSYQVLRSWAPVNKCNIAGSVTTKGTNYFVGIICCDGNGCTPSLPDPASMSGVSNANGVQCKSCNYAGQSSCEANTYINCTGEETQCVNYTWTATLGTVTLNSFNRGCATKSLYDAQILSSTMNYMTFVNTFTESAIINPSTTTLSNGGNRATSNGGSGTTSNGGSGTTSNGGSGTTSNGGSGTTSNGGSGTTSNGGSGTKSNGGSGTTSNGGNSNRCDVGSGTTSTGGNSITAPSNGGVIFLLFSTLAAILILHQFNKDP